MPTYDYECGSCGHRYELFQSITAKPVKKCPSCAKPTAKRLIGTGASIIFKGSGFYQTDYRSESYKKAAKADAEAASGKKSESKSESKSSGGSSGSESK
jgi:putative FmdB family regulatory protein